MENKNIVNYEISFSMQVRVLKEMSTIPCYVVEEHQEVVEPLFNLIKARKVSYENLLLINFDSHSDLSIPKNLKTHQDGFLRSHDVLNEIDIESWILPLCFMDIFKGVFWLHADWTQHHFKSEEHFNIGTNVEQNKLKVTSSVDHFLSEDDYDNEKNLKNLHQISLYVHSVSPNDSESSKLKQISQRINQIHNFSHFVLSIDLDFFSTKDPFLTLFSHRQYELLKNIYAFTPPATPNTNDVQSCATHRKQQLEKLKEVFSKLDMDPDGDISGEENNFKEFVSSIKASNEGKYDWLWLHELGRSMDNTPPPHHVSTEEQIGHLMKNLASILQEMPHPCVILVSRSSADDFCPSEQVEVVQGRLLELLRKIYPRLQLNTLYK